MFIRSQVHLIFTDWDVGKPCLLMFVQFTFETFCGGVVLTQFAQSVFQTAVQSLSPINCTQILAGLQVTQRYSQHGIAQISTTPHHSDLHNTASL